MAAQGNGGPIVDGAFVPRDPFDPDAPSVSAGVPMIIGTCLEDSGLSMTDWDLDKSGLVAWTESQVPGRSADVLAEYAKIYPDKRPFLIKAMIATDRVLRRNAVTQAERKSAQNAGMVYMYRWDWPTPAQGGKFGAVHGTDLSLSFSNPDTDVGMNTPDAQRMALRIGSAAIAFAKTGNPDNAAIPHWPAYDAAARATMIFDNQTRVENDPHHDLRLMWDSLPAA
jgi:para-nitrobenzyl esterase